MPAVAAKTTTPTTTVPRACVRQTYQKVTLRNEKKRLNNQSSN